MYAATNTSAVDTQAIQPPRSAAFSNHDTQHLGSGCLLALGLIDTAHSALQLIVLLIIVFSADSWLDIPSGRGHKTKSSVHFTIVFNTFVFMQAR
jgi:hypothetical protein